MIEEEEDDQAFDAAILQHTKQVYTHMLVGWLLLFLMAGLSVGGLAVLGKMLQTTDELMAVEPETRSQALRKKIALVQNNVKKQYQAYEARMDDQSVFTINKAFGVMYQVSRTFEEDYARLLAGYQKSSFNLASRVRGSGEWYFYYERELNAFIQRQKLLEERLKAYVADHGAMPDS